MSVVDTAAAVAVVAGSTDLGPKKNNNDDKSENGRQF